jgi:hypothetical protein
MPWHVSINVLCVDRERLRPKTQRSRDGFFHRPNLRLVHFSPEPMSLGRLRQNSDAANSKATSKHSNHSNPTKAPTVEA